MLQGKWTAGGHVFFAKYTFCCSCNLSYIFIKKSYFTIIFVKSGLTPCTICFLFRLHFLQDFLYHLKAQSNKQ